MTNVLAVAASELGYPVPFVILVKSNDRLVHPRLRLTAAQPLELQANLGDCFHGGHETAAQW